LCKAGFLNQTIIFISSRKEGCVNLKNLIKGLKKQSGYLFILPELVLFAIFIFYPIIDAIKMSFYGHSMINPEFMGLANYVTLFKSENFIFAIRNTFYFVVGIVPLGLGLSLLISVAVINSSEKFQSFIRGAFYLPVVVSFVALTMVWLWIYNPVYGLLRYLMNSLGMQPFAVLSDPTTALLALIFVVFTTSLGQPIIIYIAALGGIPATYFEAAEIDGVTGFKKLVYITWPLLKPTTLFLAVTTTINIFQVFVVVQLMTSGGPFNSTTTILFELYRTAFIYNNFGLACAMGVILFIILLLVSLVQFKFMHTEVEY